MKILLAVIVTLMSGGAMAADFDKETKAWREEQEKKLRGEEGWLSVVGLTWLKDGDNYVGASDRATIILPEGAPLKLGVITYSGGKAQIRFDSVKGVTVAGKPVELSKTYDLVDDESGSATEIKVGSVKFYLIKRSAKVGVRMKDSASHARRNFKGRKWYGPNLKFKIEAKWTELQTPKMLNVPDILGNSNDEPSPGYATFELDGKKLDLYPTKDGDTLFFVFNDKTSGKETYGAGRFLYAGLPKDGKVVLDFNRAINPPCAFTEFATCPLPPKENRLQAAIPAGELKPEDHK